MLLKLENPDLTHDPHACRVEKDEVVAVNLPSRRACCAPSGRIAMRQAMRC
jgi:hypothetical protein